MKIKTTNQLLLGLLLITTLTACATDIDGPERSNQQNAVPYPSPMLNPITPGGVVCRDGHSPAGCVPPPRN